MELRERAAKEYILGYNEVSMTKQIIMTDLELFKLSRIRIEQKQLW